jgi:putative ABC transport system ATP-binding protein
MSGGQQQRVSIARALVNDPKILYADEPTGNLDTKTAKEIMEILQERVRQWEVTLMMVTHNLELAEYADRVIHMKDGQIIKTEKNIRTDKTVKADKSVKADKNSKIDKTVKTDSKKRDRSVGE